MSIYEFSLRQEVLMEVGASILGDLSRYSQRNNIESDSEPASILSALIWNAKQDILLANSESELNEIEGQFNLANQFSSIEEYGYAEKILLQCGEQNGENYDFELMSIYSQAHNSQKMIDKGLDIVHTNPQQAQMIQNNFQYYLNTDVNDEFYDKLRLTLLQRVQKNPTTAFSEMLVWLFVQKKNNVVELMQSMLQF